jgi:hypothetical protein
MNFKSHILFYLSIFLLIISVFTARTSHPQKNAGWINRSQENWPQITMINNIEFIDKKFPDAGCSFLLDTGKDTLAVTAKHILIYFKSEKMNAVCFENTLTKWKMFPKDNPADSIVVDALINENVNESLIRIPPKIDWLLFTLQKKSKNIQPLKFRNSPLKPGEKVYIIGWRYTDINCPQVIYNGNYVKSENGTVLITTEKLADNKIPGLSGSPVIDSNGNLIGIMSQKAGRMERLSSIEYPKKIVKKIISREIK